MNLTFGRTARRPLSALTFEWSAALIALIINAHPAARWDCEISSLHHGRIVGHEARAGARLALSKTQARFILPPRTTQNLLQTLGSVPRPLRTRGQAVCKQYSLDDSSNNIAIMQHRPPQYLRSNPICFQDRTRPKLETLETHHRSERD